MNSFVASGRDKYCLERKRARLDERAALQSARNGVRTSLKVTPFLPRLVAIYSVYFVKLIQ